MVSISEVESNLQKVLEDRPFDEYIKYPGVEPLYSNSARSGRSFVGKGSDARYKLRLCKSIGDALWIESYVNELPHHFPKLLGREGEYLLFEYLEGWSVVLGGRQFGRMTAEMHRLELSGGHKHNPQRFFYTKIGRLYARGSISYEEFSVLGQEFERLYDEEALPPILDFSDSSSGNFMTDGQRTVCVDEEAVYPRMPGFGGVQVCWEFENRSQWEEFLEGYGEAADPDIFSEGYLRLLQIMGVVNKMEFRSRDGRNMRKLTHLLERLLAGESAPVIGYPPEVEQHP